MELKPFYFDVEIKGVALVYADTEKEARTQLLESGVMAAGNKLRRLYLDVVSDGRENP